MVVDWCCVLAASNWWVDVLFVVSLVVLVSLCLCSFRREGMGMLQWNIYFEVWLRQFWFFK